MLENTFLSLSGHGYLHDVRCYRRDEWYATLNVIQPFNHSPSDDVWLECQFNMDKFPILAKLDHYLDKGKSVILKFDAEYSGFQQYYAGLSENDPRFIVQLRGKLLHAHEYDIEGLNTFYHHKRSMQNQRVLHKPRAHYKMEPLYG
jgi:hypothetical protein